MIMTIFFTAYFSYLVFEILKMSWFFRAMVMAKFIVCIFIFDRVPCERDLNIKEASFSSYKIPLPQLDMYVCSYVALGTW